MNADLTGKVVDQELNLNIFKSCACCASCSDLQLLV